MKTFETLSFCKLVILFITVCFISSCQEEDPADGSFKKQLDGHVQKGPYSIGAGITILELNDLMTQTGRSFLTQVDHHSGSFQLPETEFKSQFVELSADGFYFDEVKGDLSSAPLILNALVDIADEESVNVNVLTHLEKTRVERLIQNNLSFTDAKAQAQSEILAAFGFEGNDIANSENLDISGQNEGDAILLAISAILQGDRSVAKLSELLANISTDLRDDGIVQPEVLQNLRSTSLNLDLADIRSNLVDRYSEIGSSAQIPAFEIYVNKFLEHTGAPPDAETKASTSMTTTTVTLNAMVVANSVSTTVSFDYGKTQNYSSSVTVTIPVTGNSLVPVSAYVSGLDPESVYHFRVKAENAKGITYGNDFTFVTIAPVKDMDGNIYPVAQIGTQVWMMAPLKTTKLNDGTPISLTESNTDWANLQTPGYSWYNNNKAGEFEHGAFYNWETIATGKVCPIGWHIPSRAEWDVLVELYGGYWLGRTKLMADGYQFSGLRSADGVFSGQDGDYRTGIWWSTTLTTFPGESQEIVVGLGIETSSSPTAFGRTIWKKMGVTARCLKD